jgi:hypothetical protein
LKKSVIASVVGLVSVVGLTSLGYGQVTELTTEEVATVDNVSPLTWNVGLEFSNARFFRGLPQLTDQLVTTPSLGVGYLVLNNNEDDLLNSLSVNANVDVVLATDNNWPNSSNGWLYEATLNLGVSSNVLHNLLTVGLSYNLYNSPSNSFTTVNELSGFVQFNDGKFWKEVSFLPEFTGLRPYVLYAFELDDTRGLGSDNASYVELGVNPGVTLLKNVNLTLPTKFGFGVDNYYGDSDFGYVSTGPVVNLPLNTNWDLNVGFEFVITEGDVQQATGNGNVETVAFVGFVYRR